MDGTYYIVRFDVLTSFVRKLRAVQVRVHLADNVFGNREHIAIARAHSLLFDLGVEINGKTLVFVDVVPEES